MIAITTRKAITTQLREYCEANGLTYDVTTVRGALRIVIDGETLSPGEAADRYLSGGFDAAYGTAGATSEPAGAVATLFGAITPPPPSAPGLFDTTPELAVTADSAPPASPRRPQPTVADVQLPGAPLFALELAEGTPETGFTFGIGDL